MFSQLHLQAQQAASNLKAAEAELIALLQQIDACRGYWELGYQSLFVYVNKGLGLSEARTQQLIVVARKAREVPALQLAISEGKITVAKAKSMTSVLTSENQKEWIERAQSSTTRQLEKAVAEAKPEEPKRENIRHQGGKARLSFTLDEETFEALKRAQELLTQKKSKPVSLADAIKELAVRYVCKEDPVAKADRNGLKTFHAKDSTKAKHAVNRRDRGSCQFVLPTGEKYGSRHWIHIHHIKPRSAGGTDDPAYLTTLCSPHHRMAHESNPYQARSAPRAAASAP